MVRQSAAHAAFNGVEVGVAGPHALEFVLRRGSGRGLTVRLSSQEARAFAEALLYWAKVSELSAPAADAMAGRAQPQSDKADSDAGPWFGPVGDLPGRPRDG